MPNVMKKYLLFLPLVAMVLMSCGQAKQGQSSENELENSQTEITTTDNPITDRSADTAIYRQIWHLLEVEHQKEEVNPLLGFDDEADYDEFKTDAGVQIDYWGTAQCYYHGFRCYPLENGAMKVYEYVAWVMGEKTEEDDPDFEPSFDFYCYVYKDGTLTAIDAEPEILEVVPEASLYKYRPAEFTENGIFFNDIYWSEFEWDGTKMIQKQK